MVFEKALDFSSLPNTLRNDLELVSKLEGRYRVTKIIQEVELGNMGYRQDEPCYHWKRLKKSMDPDVMQTLVDRAKPVVVVARVDDKSKMYREGIRWTIQNEAFGNKEAVTHMVRNRPGHISILLRLQLLSPAKYWRVKGKTSRKNAAVLLDFVQINPPPFPQ